MPVLDEMAVVRIPYVKVYTDRHGKVRRYFRKPGCKPVALPGVPGPRRRARRRCSGASGGSSRSQRLLGTSRRRRPSASRNGWRAPVRVRHHGGADRRYPHR
jgi:hypothetical protein